MENVILGIIIVAVVIVIFVVGSSVKLWIQALVSGAHVGLLQIVFMRFRKVPPKLIVESKIMAVKAGLDISTNDLESHYLAGGNVARVVQALIAADKLALPIGSHRARALGHILMGEIEYSLHRDAQATKRWKEAAEIAKTLNDKVLRFKAEFFLYKQAQEQDNRAVARALFRRLRRLSNWVPSDTAELIDFREISKQGTALVN